MCLVANLLPPKMRAKKSTRNIYSHGFWGRLGDTRINQTFCGLNFCGFLFYQNALYKDELRKILYFFFKFDILVLNFSYKIQKIYIYSLFWPL